MSSGIQTAARDPPREGNRGRFEQGLTMTSSGPLARLYHYARGERPLIVGGTVFSVLNKLFDIAPEILIGMAVDVVVNRRQSFVAHLGVMDPSAQIAWLAVATFVIWFLESLTEYCASLLWRGLAQTLQHGLRMDAYEHVQRLPMSYLSEQPTGRLMSILNDDINQLERFLDGGANSLIQVAATVVMVGGVFFYLSPTVALLAFLPIPVILAGAFAFQHRLGPRYLAVRERASLLNARLSNNLSGIINIKSYASQDREREHIDEQSRAYGQANRAAIRLSSAFTPVIRMAILAGFLSTLVMGGSMVFRGKLAVGAYSVLVFLTQRLLWPLTGLAATVDLYQRAMASTQRVLDLMAVAPEQDSLGRALPVEQVRGALRFKDLHFSYAGRSPVFAGLNLEIAAGSWVALVGSTGSGKSTLVRLLLRFYAPDGGQVELDGQDVSELQLGDLRRAVGLVSQEVFLSDDTVRANLAYGRPEATLEEIVAAAQVAEAHEFIEKLPQGYETRVGERGQALSGGQRQRLSIARAVLKNPPILILDEATSAVDNETEAALARSLTRLSRGRTTIVIAHRLSTIRHADQIFVMEKGQIAERGTHPELVERNGVYANLWRIQTGE
jgi:ATP-binding cassette subfamily B protein